VKRQWSKGEIEDLQCGQEVWEALRTAKRPDIVEVSIRRRLSEQPRDQTL
jgi:hypothetical protein